jgi:hypothetical protein
MSLHNLILTGGTQKALESLPAKDHSLVRMASQVLADERNDLNIVYAGWAFAGLPHRKPADVNKIWTRRTRQVTLTISPGVMPGTDKRIGVPYGSRARIILLYMQTEAKQTNSPEIELGANMFQWFEKMGIRAGGQQYKDVRDQVNRISRSLLTFTWELKEKGKYGFKDERMVDSGVMLSNGRDVRQGSLWMEKIRLSQSFFNAVVQHGVPVSNVAVRELNGQSASLDAYIWLAYRLHVLSGKVYIPWLELYDQFGQEYGRVRDFKSKFTNTLRAALAVYPHAVVDINDDGVVLHPSPPPIHYKPFQVITP